MEYTQKISINLAWRVAAVLIYLLVTGFVLWLLVVLVAGLLAGRDISGVAGGAVLSIVPPLGVMAVGLWILGLYWLLEEVAPALLAKCMLRLSGLAG